MCELSSDAISKHMSKWLESFLNLYFATERFSLLIFYLSYICSMQSIQLYFSIYVRCHPVRKQEILEILLQSKAKISNVNVKYQLTETVRKVVQQYILLCKHVTARIYNSGCLEYCSIFPNVFNLLACSLGSQVQKMSVKFSCYWTFHPIPVEENNQDSGFICHS